VECDARSVHKLLSWGVVQGAQPHLTCGSRPDTFSTHEGASGSAVMRSGSCGRGVLHW